jgi:hypothetical protein
MSAAAIGLDACEAGGVAPCIKIDVDHDRISVSDNGGGIGPETIDRILDYNFKTSSNAAYRSPTRGQQGNALQTILAMAHALTGRPGVTVIESRGVRHQITFSIDPISREPRLEVERIEIDDAPGTNVAVLFPTATSDDRIGLHNIACDFAVTNPHLTVSFANTADATSFAHKATDTGWQKWKPTDPTSAHWYDLSSLKTLIAAEINRARRSGSIQRPVRDFIAEFRGLAGTAKRSQICEAIVKTAKRENSPRARDLGQRSWAARKENLSSRSGTDSVPEVELKAENFSSRSGTTGSVPEVELLSRISGGQRSVEPRSLMPAPAFDLIDGAFLIGARRIEVRKPSAAVLGLSAGQMAHHLAASHPSNADTWPVLATVSGSPTPAIAAE